MRGTLALPVATGVLLAWFGEVGVIYATVVMTVAIVVFAEISSSAGADRYSAICSMSAGM